MNTYEIYAAAALSGFIASKEHHIDDCVRLAHETAQKMIDAKTKAEAKEKWVEPDEVIVKLNDLQLQHERFQNRFSRGGIVTGNRKGFV